MDVGLGLSVLGWGIAGFFLAPVAERFSAARLTMSTLQVVVGLLLATRKPIQSPASLWEILAALPSVVASGEAMWFARPLDSWPLGADLFFAVGGSLTLVSLLFLGRCFAILPGARGVVVRGPYRLIRHPVYAAELVMMVGCAWALGPVLGLVVWVFVALWVAVRIVAEERRLQQLEAYRNYCSRVPWRLVPGLW